jgi:hypothetical protein
MRVAEPLHENKGIPESGMKRLIYVTFGAALLGASAIASPASSLDVGQMAKAAPQRPALLQVRHERCALWRRVCRVRWSQGWRYRRCMAVHGCLP